MLLSQSINRRYTPPTCSLEIEGKISPLSQWTNTTLIKELNFQLHFDDPRVPPEKQLTLKGDRSQLESLCDTVSNYLQDFLKESAINLTLTAKKQETASEPELPEKSQQLLTLPIKPTLKSQSLLIHELFLGSLASRKSGAVIKLSTVQLFDLANALEACNQEIQTLPNIYSQKQKKTISLWGLSATAGVLLAVGLTLNRGQIFKPSQSPSQETIASSEQPASQRIPQSQPVIPPSPSPNKQIPTPQLTLPPAIATRKTLPPPSPVKVPQIPKLEQPTANVTQTPKDNENQVPIVIEPKIADNLPNTAKETPQLLPSPTPTDDSSLNSQDQRNVAIITPSPTIPAEVPNLKPPQSEEKSNQLTEVIQGRARQTDDSSVINQDRSNVARIAPSPTIPAEVPSLESPQSEESSNQSTETIEGDAGQIATRDRNIPDNFSLFDDLPQIEEAKSYFQQKWKPIEGLKQTLQYRLLLKKDGSIQRIIPLGQASEIYLDRTNIPLRSESFVSPLSIEKQIIIRLVLEPNGEVKTFLEQP